MTPFVALLLASSGLVQPQALPDLRVRAPKPSFGARVAGSAFAASVMPAVALAAEVSEEIEYGTVTAPNFILPLGAALAILTALLPVFLKSGDEAARQMQERDQDIFGKSMDSVGKKKK
jgi:hypothetical protein